MPLSPVPISDFAGLNLVDDPSTVGWSAATDLLNVEFDQRGRVRSRDGYAKFTASAGSVRYGFLAPMYLSSSTTRFLIAAGLNKIQTLDTTGTEVANTAVTGNVWGAARFGGSAEAVYLSGCKTDLTGAFIRKISSAGAISTPAGVTVGRTIGVTPWDNRLVTGSVPTGSRVSFSDAGAPETFGANNWIDLTPGDGESIQAIATWRELLFVFKESKFFVFYGTSTDSTGNPIFNYRAVQARVGAVGPLAFAVAPQGVYFLDRTGVYLTTGGEPQCVSTAIDPVFSGVGLSSFYQGSALNLAQLPLCALTYNAHRLYASIPTGSATVPDRTLVLNDRAETWSAFDLAGAALSTFRIADAEELVFAYPSGTNDIGRHSSSYTTDAGTSITSRYRTGFSDLGSTALKTIREWRLEGSGSPTLKTSHDFGSLETGAAVTLGVSPAILEARRRYATRGREFSWQVGGTTAWSLNSLVANVREQRAPGVHAAT